MAHNRVTVSGAEPKPGGVGRGEEPTKPKKYLPVIVYYISVKFVNVGGTLLSVSTSSGQHACPDLPP